MLGKQASGKISAMSGLILETSTEKGCLILTDKGRCLATHLLPDGPELSKQLASDVQSFLKKHSFQPEFIAVGTGPGSYTGVRVGVALAKALAYGWNIPLFGFCSLKAFAPQNEPSFAVLIDAKMGGLYVLTNASETPTLVPLAQVSKDLHSIYLFLSPHPEAIKKRISLNGIWIEAHPDAEALSMLAYNLFLQGEEAPLILSYLRDDTFVLKKVQTLPALMSQARNLEF